MFHQPTNPLVRLVVVAGMFLGLVTAWTIFGIMWGTWIALTVLCVIALGVSVLEHVVDTSPPPPTLEEWLRR